MWIIRVLHAFKIECDSNGIHEGAAMWLFPYFLKKFTAAISAPCLSHGAKKSNYGVKDAVLTTKFQVVNHVLETYTADHIIKETDSDTACFVNPSNMWPLRLWHAHAIILVYTKHCPVGIAGVSIHLVDKPESSRTARGTSPHTYGQWAQYK